MIVHIDGLSEFITIRFTNRAATAPIMEPFRDVFVELIDGPERSTAIAGVVLINLSDIPRIRQLLGEFQKTTGIVPPVIDDPQWQTIQRLSAQLSILRI